MRKKAKLLMIPKSKQAWRIYYQQRGLEDTQYEQQFEVKSKTEELFWNKNNMKT
jgi:hypothetical protein